MIIYKLTNLQNGKVYIGQTTRSLRQRLLDHSYQAKRSFSYLARAIHKYGMSAFKAEVLDTAPDLTTLNQKEEQWIAHYGSMVKTIGYNMVPGGLNHKHLEETKRLISVKNKSKIHTKEHNLKVSRARKGYHPTPEALKNQSLSHLGKKLSERQKLNISLALRGKPKSEETKRHMRHPKTEAHRKSISLARRKREQKIS
jgi:group I intron endonuclease